MPFPIALLCRASRAYRHVRNLTSAAELLDGSSKAGYADAFRWGGMLPAASGAHQMVCI
jgi:hypothetical protein